MKTEQEIIDAEQAEIIIQTIDEYTVHRCTQCGEINMTHHGHRGGLFCSCPIAKPWEWIWTPGWSRHYNRLRKNLGINV